MLTEMPVHLARDVDRPFGLDHMKPDAAEEEEIWTTGSEYERGIIALSDSEVEDMGLPYAQRFPWDFTKGIYLLNGYHNLHCVVSSSPDHGETVTLDIPALTAAQRTIRNSLMEFKQGVPQSRSWEHLVHCLHTLRDDVICNADDTPRYSGFQPPRSSGLGQDRKCRDWKKLEAFANEHNSCFKHVDPANDTFRAIDRYRYCPEGSPYKHDAETKWLPPNWSREDSGEI